MDKEIGEKFGEVKELARVLYLDHDESKAELMKNLKKLREVEESMMKADKRFDRKRERG
jgi:hypothetical protein